MSTNVKPNPTQHPDIAEEELASYPYTIEKVGMSQVEMPITVQGLDGKRFTLPAKMDLQVNLTQAHIKGIHMSRLYHCAMTHFENNTLNMAGLAEFMSKLNTVQGSISDKAYAKINFDYPLKRQSLLSGNTGWRYYPLSLDLKQTSTGVEIAIAITFTYSSTCPCSAALSRQLLVDRFHKSFENHDQLSKTTITEWLSSAENTGGLPHAQRSKATIQLKYNSLHLIPHIESIINQVEGRLKTPVQGFVKRQDEQEFARLNAENLLFSEDAVRLFKDIFEQDDKVADYHIYVEHLESLHPHNAVATAVKGVEGGFRV